MSLSAALAEWPGRDSHLQFLMVTLLPAWLRRPTHGNSRRDLGPPFEPERT